MKFAMGVLFLTFLMLPIAVVIAGDDATIPAAEKEQIKATMVNYIKNNSTRNGNFLLLDPETKQTRILKFDHVHHGVVKHADGFLACVDLLDGKTIVDVDFVVSKEGDDYRVSKVAIHKVGSAIRTGHLDH